MVDAFNYRAGELSQLGSGRKRARERRQDEANQCKLPRTKAYGAIEADSFRVAKLAALPC